MHIHIVRYDLDLAGTEMRMGLPDKLQVEVGRQVVSGPEPKVAQEDSGPKARRHTRFL